MSSLASSVACFQSLSYCPPSSPSVHPQSLAFLPNVGRISSSSLQTSVPCSKAFGVDGSDCSRRRRSRSWTMLRMENNKHHQVGGPASSSARNNNDDDANEYIGGGGENGNFNVNVDHDGEALFLQSKLAQLETLEDIFDDGEFDDEFDDDDDDLDLGEADDDVVVDWDDILWDEETLTELLGSEVRIGHEDDIILLDEDEEVVASRYQRQTPKESAATVAAAGLEQALLQGVVPVSAAVGCDSLPGDFGFDPLNLATKDYFRATQSFLINHLIPGGPSRDDDKEVETTTTAAARPKALILRDYREAEIRHGRLAMLAAVFWPLQELLDRLLLDEDQFGPLLYGPVTLPYFPLVMTAIMLLLGYLDIYSQAIKEMDSIGEAFLPGDCFWDPLRMLAGAPDRMKRNMQERELFNGRVAMIAVAVFIWEEGVTHLPLIEIPGNEILFEPAYQVPFIQKWLDAQFIVVDR